MVPTRNKVWVWFLLSLPLVDENLHTALKAELNLPSMVANNACERNTDVVLDELGID